MDMMSNFVYLREPASIMLILTALAVPFASAMRSLLHGKQMDQNINFSVKSITLDWSDAVDIPFTNSYILILLLSMFSYVSDILIAFIALGSITSLFFCFTPCVTYAKLKFGFSDPTFSCGHLKSFTLTQGMLMFVCVGIVMAWLVSGHWILTNLLAISIFVKSLSFIRLPNLKIFVLLLVTKSVYDVFWFFFSKGIFEVNVMIAIATIQATNPVHAVANSLSLPGLQLITKKLELPVKIAFPRNLLGRNVPGTTAFMMIDLGDMAIPGMLLALVLFFDHQKCRDLAGHSITPSPRGIIYLCLGLSGYAIGLVIAVAAEFLTHSPQPALLYLGPSTLGPIIVVAWVRKELRELWNWEAHDHNLSNKAPMVEV